MKLTALIIISCFLLCSGSFCFGEQVKRKNKTYKTISDVPADVWKELSRKKIYFGHQSVGFNIIQGLQDIIDEHKFIQLKISDKLDREDIKPGTIIHSTIGKNVDPLSKIKDFSTIINGAVGKRIDIAGFKFCYVDIENSKNNKTILANYIENIDLLKKENPDLTIIHFTVPLMSIRSSWKDKIKKILGRTVHDNSLENVARNEYNKLLREQLGSGELLFDIAKIESTFPDGSRCTFIRDGKTYFSMVPEYTYDGGHLTKIGRRKVAEQFLLFLASID